MPGTQPAGAPWTPPLPPPAAGSYVPEPLGSILPAPGFAPGATFTLTTSATLSEEYTDNFNLFEDQEEQGAVVTGSQSQRVSNFRTRLSGGLTLGINGARTKGYLSGGLSVIYDTARDGLSGALFPSFRAAVIHELTPNLRLSITDSLTRDDDTFQGDAFGVRRERSLFTANRFTISLQWLIDIVQTEFFYRNSIFLSEDTDFVQGDDTLTISHILGARASFPVAFRTSATVGYEFSLSDTSGDVTDDDPQGIGNLVYAQVNRQVGQFASVGLSGSYRTLSFGASDIWNISANATYGLPTGLSASGSVGYSMLQGRSSGASGSSEDDSQGAITTRTQISYAFPTGATASVGFFSGFRETFLEGEDFGVVLTRSYFGTFSYPLAPSITGRITATYNENELTGVDNTRSRGALDSLTVTASVGWRILRWLSATAAYSYSRYTGGRVAFQEELGITDIPGDPITENRVYVGLTATF